MNITYYGHSCFGVDVAGHHLLLDPFITPNPMARSIDVSRIPADTILISHAHEDHVADAVVIAKRTGARVLCNYEISLWLSRQGVDNLFPMNLGGTARLDWGRAKLVPALHSSTLPDGSPGGNPGGWIVETPEGNWYYSGDTALSAEMKLFGESSPPLRFAFLCIGDVFTMGFRDAAVAARWLGVSTVIGMHYDTFPPIRLDHAEAKAAFQAAGLRLHLLPLGTATDF
jgi:L-ascorbate metabolism protein UlaG (beta-lactamase superfamily)